MQIKIDAVLCGKSRPFRGTDEPSAIDKTPMADRVRITPTGLVGDEQADLSVHGGPEKAIHHYPRDHYPAWRDEFGDHHLLSAPGAFGENISTSGLTEDDVCIGDRFRLGTALVEVSQGRQPCWKLNHRFGGLPVNAAFVRSRRTGWYYRVIEPGYIAAGDSLALVDRPYCDWSVTRVFGLLIAGDHKQDPAALEAMGVISPLAEPWKRRRAALMGA